MSWSASAAGLRDGVIESINNQLANAEQHGYITADQIAMVQQAMIAYPGNRLSVSASGHNSDAAHASTPSYCNVSVSAYSVEDVVGESKVEVVPAGAA